MIIYGQTRDVDDLLFFLRRCALVATLLVCGVGCRNEYNDRDFLIPEGFSGPVLVLYEQTAGVSPKRSKEGRDQLQVPPDGVLRLRRKSPEVVRGFDRYFLVRANGTRERIPVGHELPPSETKRFQVFGQGLGGMPGRPVLTRLADGTERWVHDSEGPGSFAVEDFIVGAPASRNDWHSLRDALLERTLYGEHGPPWLRDDRLGDNGQGTTSDVRANGGK